MNVERSAQPQPPTRLLCLDVLRAIAVLLVIGRHVDIPEDSPLWLHGWRRGGWVGVDMFFVLSGFLVSGLLFREYIENRSIHVSRFLIRRGLKIYPAFYVFLLVTTLLLRYEGYVPPTRDLIGELVFLQNYVASIWNHTWSLAVEEHFYLGIVVILALIARHTSHLHWIVGTLMPLTVAVLGLRILSTELPWWRVFSRTHFRIDALAFGVLLAYLWHFAHARFIETCSRFRWLMLPLGIGLLAPAFLWPVEDTPAIVTYGLTAFYLGSGLILSAMLCWKLADTRFTRAIGQVGLHSYSIYLWHIPVIRWVVPTILKVLGIDQPSTRVLVACVASVTVGIVMARLVELPALRLRDSLFPSRSRGVSVASLPQEERGIIGQSVAAASSPTRS